MSAGRLATVALFSRSLLVAVLLGLAVGSCTQRTEGEAPAWEAGGADAGQPVDPALLAFLSKARAAHHRADAFEQSGNLDLSIAELQRVTTGAVPRGDRPYVEADEVLADTRARLADLKSRLGRFDDALGDVAAGLKLARARTYFRGHLFEVRGLVEERRCNTLAKQGHEVEAQAAKERALKSFEQAIDIQDEVIRKSLSTEQPR
jgi:tetratricopeptide (TPR) repeat protein